MSSRFIPPNVGAIFSTNLMISSGSWVFVTMGIASTLPNSLNKMAFHSMTGNPASPQIFPSQSTAEPSLTTATLFPFRVYSYARAGSLAISVHGFATPGV